MVINALKPEAHFRLSLGPGNHLPLIAPRNLHWWRQLIRRIQPASFKAIQCVGGGLPLSHLITQLIWDWQAHLKVYKASICLEERTDTEAAVLWAV